MEIPKNIILITKLLWVIFVYKSILSIILDPIGEREFLAYSLASVIFILVLFITTLIINFFVVRGNKFIFWILLIVFLFDTVKIVLYLVQLPHLNSVQIISLTYYMFTSWFIYLLIKNRSFFLK